MRFNLQSAFTTAKVKKNSLAHDYTYGDPVNI